MDTRSAASVRSQRRTPPPVPKAPAPWLIFPYGKGMKSQAFFNICDPHDTFYEKSIPELRGKSFWQKPCHRNWLIILCQDKSYESKHNLDKWNQGDCFLWNHVSLEHIRLPSLGEWVTKPKKYVLIDCVLTSPPNRRNYKDDSMVIFLFGAPFDKKDDHVLLLFCLPGDKQWKTKRISRGEITGVNSQEDLLSLHYFKGKMYVTFVTGDRLLEFEKQHLLDNNVKTLSVRSHEPVIGNKKLLPIGSDYNIPYYVQSEDEFFMIWVSSNSRCKQVMSVYVWSLDFSSKKWEDINDLGDHVIFAGMRTGFCCSAAKLGLKTGGLYYTIADDQSLYKFQAKGGNEVTLPCPKIQTPWFPAEWIMGVPENSQKRMESNREEQQQHEKDFTLKEIQGTKACFHINGNSDNQTKEEISPWDTLNEDTLAVISACTHPLDYVHLRSVCTENRRLMPPTAPKRGANSAGCPCISPWLMFPRGNTYTFVDPVHDNETYLMSFCRSVQDATVLHQKNGWLLMSREREIFFYNPFTREVIRLPDLPDGYIISIFYFYDSPTASNCAVFAIDQSVPSETCILITMRGEDAWLPCEFPNTNPEIMMLHGTAPVTYRGVFYCVNCDGTLGAYDVTKDVSWSVLSAPKKIFNNDMHPNLLVECGGDLLLVKIGHLGKSVRIYRLDLSEMEWVKVETLGKYMLFISETSCLSAIAPNSQMENVICFPRLYLNGGGILIYSLETGSYRSSSGDIYQDSFNSFYETEGWLSNCTWIQPNWSKSTQQQLNWLNRI